MSRVLVLFFFFRVFNCNDKTVANTAESGWSSPLSLFLPVSSMAVDYPLVLYDCHFEGLSWQQEKEEVNHVLCALQQHWTQSAVKAHILHGMIQGLEATGNCSLLYFTLKLSINRSHFCCCFLGQQNVFSH